MTILDDLNDDVINHIISFISKDLISIISEVSTRFNSLVSYRLKYFPKKNVIFSSLSLFIWAIDHNYNKSPLKLIRRAIVYGNEEILEYIKNNLNIEKRKFYGELYILAYEMNKPNIITWLKRNHFNYNYIYNNLVYTRKYMNFFENEFITTPDKFYEVVKKDNLKKVIWILQSIDYLKEYVVLYASECNSKKVFLWSLENLEPNFYLCYYEQIRINLEKSGDINLINYYEKVAWCH